MAVRNVTDLVKTTRRIESFPEPTKNPYVKTKDFTPYPKILPSGNPQPWYINESIKPTSEIDDKGEPWYHNGTKDDTTRRIDEYSRTTEEPWYLDKDKKPYDDSDTGSGELWYADKERRDVDSVESGSGPLWYGERNRKPISEKNTGSGKLWYADKETKKVTGYPSGKIPVKHRRPIQKVTPSYKAKPKYTKKRQKMNKITNRTQKKQKDQRFSVRDGHDFIDKHKKADKLMRFNLNMTYGDTYGNTAKYFDRLYSIYPNEEIDNVCQYVFIVRPDLNILSSPNDLISISQSEMNKKGYLQNSSPSNDPLFKYMLQKYPNILRSLTTYLEGGDHDFIPFLVGRTESLQIPNYSIKSYTINQPYTSFQLPYASHALASQTGGDFTIDFREDKEYRVHKLFQTWVYYIDAVTRNIFSPKMKHIIHNKLDYACSVYCITCLQDAETIVHWAKYTGAFPTEVPNSDISFNLRGTPNNKVSIPFAYFHQEALNPYILLDFNKNSHVRKPDKTPYIPIYRSDTLNDIGMTDYRKDRDLKYLSSHSINAKTKFRKSTPVSLGSGNGLVGAPFICKVKGKNGSWNYALRWKKIKDLSGK